MALVRTLATVAAALAAAAGVVHAQPASCNGSPNLLPPWTGTPTLVNKTTNGVKLLAAPANLTAPTIVLHVYGTAYEMGFAYGSLLSAEINTLLPQVMTYLEAQLNGSLPDWIPALYREVIVTEGLEAALNLTYEVTLNFTPPHHYAMLQGIADGAGLDFMTITRMSMIPELTKATTIAWSPVLSNATLSGGRHSHAAIANATHFVLAACSIALAWGEATANGTANGAAVHLRALDWDTDGPFQQYPLLTTFHPAAGDGVAFTTLGWAGLIGAITGMSSSGMGVGEKVWLQYAGVENIFGYVWTFLLQDILQYDWDTDQALSRIATANRTCSIWVSLSDRYNLAGRVIGYSNQQVSIYNARNFPSYANHDLFPSALFINKHVQPSSEPCMNDLMHLHYGAIDAPTLARDFVAREQTGDAHIAIYDWGNTAMWISNAGLADASGNAVPAYQRQFLVFDMAAMWNTSLSSFD